MGNKPSLRASIQKGKWPIVSKILETPEGRDRARNKTYQISNETMSALQMACRYKAPSNIIQSLVRIGQPMSASRPCQLTPLHYAVMTKHPSPQVVTILLQAFPGDTAKRSSSTTNQQTPIHMACLNRAPPEIIQQLHERDPTAAEIHNANGQSAWQAACTHSWLLHPIWRRKVKRILMESQSPRARVVPNHTRSPSTNNSSPRSSHNRTVVEATAVPPPPRNPDTIPAAIIVETITTIPMIPTAPPDSLLEEEEEEEEDLCVLCFQNKAEMALIPCGHVCLCRSCCDDQTLNEFLHRKCPVCRQPFRDPLRIYQSGVSAH